MTAESIQSRHLTTKTETDRFIEKLKNVNFNSTFQNAKRQIDSEIDRVGNETLDQMHHYKKPSLYNKTAAAWGTILKKEFDTTTATHTVKTPKKSHFSTRASSQKPALALPKLSLLDQEECGETKFFQAYLSKVQMVQPDPGQLTVKSVLQSKSLTDQDIEKY